MPAGSTALKRLPSLERDRVPLGAGAFSYRISDEEGRLNVNGGVADRMQRLLTAIGVDKIERDSIVDAIEDWRDANDTTRTNGAESDDYLKLPVPYRARNGNFQDTDELLQVKGITPEMYSGPRGQAPPRRGAHRAQPRHRQHQYRAGAGALFPGPVRCRDQQYRPGRARTTPIPTVPGRFGGRRVTVGSTTFRIDAEGIVGGEPKARIVAIVQKSAGGAGHPADGHRGCPGGRCRCAAPRQEESGKS